MSAHTPGPWKHTNNVAEEQFADIEAVDGLLYIRASWGSMGRLAKGERKRLQVEMEANARLIAAAPGLLDALQDLAGDMADRFDLDCPSTNPGIKTTIAAARAAISKATGGTQA